MTAPNEILRQHRLRPTAGRQAVYRTLCEAPGEWMCAETVFARLSAQRSKLGTSTIARVLAELARTGLAEKREDGRRFWFRHVSQRPLTVRLVVDGYEWVVSDPALLDGLRLILTHHLQSPGNSPTMAQLSLPAQLRVDMSESGGAL